MILNTKVSEYLSYIHYIQKIYFEKYTIRSWKLKLIKSHCLYLIKYLIQYNMMYDSQCMTAQLVCRLLYLVSHSALSAPVHPQYLLFDGQHKLFLLD